MEWPTEVCGLIKCSGTKRLFQHNISELPQRDLPLCLSSVEHAQNTFAKIGWIRMALGIELGLYCFIHFAHHSYFLDLLNDYYCNCILKLKVSDIFICKCKSQLFHLLFMICRLCKLSCKKSLIHHIIFH